jgi:hypothetical protein
MMLFKLVILISALFSLNNVYSVDAIRSSSTTTVAGDTSSSSYISVRALDEFGNAVQVSHAMEAAQRHGRLVVAAVVHNNNNNYKSNPLTDDDMILKTTTTKTDGDNNDVDMSDGKNKGITTTTNVVPQSSASTSSSKSSFIVVVSVGNTPVVHSIRLPLQDEVDTASSSSSSSSSMLAMCCTGIKGDANWLIGKVRRHIAEIWESYNHSNNVSAPSIAYLVARILGRFANHQEKSEWQSSLGLPGKHESKEQRQQQSNWARPLGVQTMILSSSLSSSSLSSSSTSTSTKRDTISIPPPPPDGLLLVEPSGRILTPTAHSSSGRVSVAAMGKDSEKIQARLMELFRPTINNSGHETDTGGSTFHRSSSSLPSSPPTLLSSWEEHPPASVEVCRDTLIRIILDELVTTSSRVGSTSGELVVESFSSTSSSDRQRRRTRGGFTRAVYRYDNSKTFSLISDDNSSGRKSTGR